MQKDSVWNFGPIEVEIYMEHSDICRRLPCELDISCTPTTAESRANIWYQLNAFKAPVASAAVLTKVIVLLLMTFCLLFLPLCESVIVLCFVVVTSCPF